jgi:RimJ/RimL family protein N-acetyltransferase
MHEALFKVLEMWQLRLRDGREVVIRFLNPEDRDGLFRMFSSMSEKALEWSAAPYTMDVIDRWIGNIPSLIPLVAEYDKRIIGYAVIYKYPHQRRKGIGDLAIYLHQDFQKAGLGTAMTEKLLELAKKERMHKIELGVVADNEVAKSLYQKFGFKTEGVSKDSFFGFDGKYHDVVHMGLILD